MVNNDLRLELYKECEKGGFTLRKEDGTFYADEIKMVNFKCLYLWLRLELECVKDDRRKVENEDFAYTRKHFLNFSWKSKTQNVNNPSSSYVRKRNANVCMTFMSSILIDWSCARYIFNLEKLITKINKYVFLEETFLSSHKKEIVTFLIDNNMLYDIKKDWLDDFICNEVGGDL